MEPAPGAARFLTGTPIVAANYAASAGYEIIAEIGVDRIRENSMRQTALLVELVDDAGFELTSPREPDEARRLGRLPRARTSRRCTPSSRGANIICDTRPDAGIRFGPHFFTSDDEIRFAVSQVQEILASGVHLERAHAAAGLLEREAEHEQHEAAADEDGGRGHLRAGDVLQLSPSPGST